MFNSVWCSLKALLRNDWSFNAWKHLHCQVLHLDKLFFFALLFKVVTKVEELGTGLETQPFWNEWEAAFPYKYNWNSSNAFIFFSNLTSACAVLQLLFLDPMSLLSVGIRESAAAPLSSALQQQDAHWACICTPELREHQTTQKEKVQPRKFLLVFQFSTKTPHCMCNNLPHLWSRVSRRGRAVPASLRTIHILRSQNNSNQCLKVGILTIILALTSRQKHRCAEQKR